MKMSQLVAAAILAMPAVSPSTAAPHPPPVSVNLDERGRPLLPPALARALELSLTTTPEGDNPGLNINCNLGCTAV